jgi:energy-converting hydrogenase Eha subunit B
LIPLFVMVTFWVTIESVASRWHYMIDLPAGLLLAVLVIWLTNRLCGVSDDLRMTRAHA